MSRNVSGTKRNLVTPNKTKSGNGYDVKKYDKHSTPANLAGAGKATVLDGQTGGADELRMNWNRYPSETIPNQFFSTANQVDVKITAAPVDYADKFWFEFTIANSNNVAMIMVHPAYWFSRIECLLNGGQADDQRFDDQAYLDYVLNVTDQERSRMALGQMYDYSYDRNANRYDNHSYDAPKDANFQIPANSQKVFMIPYKTVWHESRPFLPAVAVETRFRLYTGQAQLQDPTSPAYGLNPPEMSSISSYFYGPIFETSIRNALTARYKSRTSSTHIMVWERQIIGTPGLNPNVETTDQILTSINGKYAGLGLFLRPIGTTGIGRYSDIDYGDANGATWKRLLNLTLNDSNGNPIGYTRTEGDKLLFNFFPLITDSAFTFEKNFYLWNFSKNIKNFVCCGRDGGSMTLDGSWTLRFTPIVDPVDAASCNFVANYNCELIVMGFRYAEIRQVPSGKGTMFQLIKF